MKRDPVQEIVAIVDRLRPLGESRPAVEAAIRREFGGEEIRIPRRAPVTLEAVNAGLYAGLPVREVARDLGISRATVYRMLAAPRKSRPAAV